MLSFAEFGFVAQIGGLGFDDGQGIAVDSAGSAYVSGGRDLSGQGFADFVAKYEPDGTLAWHKSFGGPDDDAVEIAVDDVGNVYTTGRHIHEIFIRKQDTNGNVLWEKSPVGSGGNKSGHGIAIAAGNVYVTGVFKGTVDFDPESTYSDNRDIRTSAGAGDAFILKLETNGNFLWVKSVGGVGAEDMRDVAIDDNGNVYAIGTFSLTADMDPGPGVVSVTARGKFNDGDDVFIVKLNSAGEFQWVFDFGGVGRDFGAGLAVDAAGNVYASGLFASSVDFNPTNAGTTVHSARGTSDAFVLKIDTSGSFQWVRTLGGGTSDEEAAGDVALDKAGNVYATGHFADTSATDRVDFDPGPGVAHAQTNTGIYVWKLDPNGNFSGATGVGDSASDGGTSIAVDESSRIYVVGRFDGTIDFDPSADGDAELRSVGGIDAFVWQLTQQRPVLREGIDRWYATSGVDQTMPVKWTVDIQNAGNYLLDVDIAGVFDQWELTDGATVSVDHGSPISFGIGGVANLGSLDPGIHEIRINSFTVPTEATVEEVVFQLNRIIPGDVTREEHLSALFIADHPEEYATRAYPVEVDGVGITLNGANALVDHFAPILHFNQLERYAMPFEVGLSLNADNVVRDSARRQVSGSSDDFLDLSVLTTGSWPRSGSTAAMYASVIICRAGMQRCTPGADLAINYYAHYPLSNWLEHGGFNTHEGDWEGTTVFLRKQDNVWRPASVTFDRHLVLSRTVDWANLYRDGAHVHQFVGLGGHAAYAGSGQHRVPTLIGLIPEYHLGNSRTFDPANGEVHYLPRVANDEAPTWLQYPGLWGNPDSAVARLGVLASSPPRGPAFGNRWINPWEWSTGVSVFEETPAPWAMVLEPGVLTIQGNSASNVLQVSAMSTVWRVTLDGRSVFVDSAVSCDGHLTCNNPYSDYITRIRAYGLDGNDAIIARHVPAILEAYGGAGNDLLIGSLGNDLLVGGRGKDRLFGDEGDDNLFGGDGDDLLVGGAGADRLDGGTGNDILHGGHDRDRDMLIGGAGRDIFILMTDDDEPLDLDPAIDFIIRPLRSRPRR